MSERLSAARRLGRIERREFSEPRRRLQTTRTPLHLSVAAFVPLVLAAVTYLSNRVQTLSFLLFPPPAAGAYTPSADPEGRYAGPVRREPHHRRGRRSSRSRRTTPPATTSVGSSGERSPASRLLSRPTYERLRDVGCDVAVFDRASE